MEWCGAPFKRGDILRVKVRFYHHFGLYVSADEVIQFGLPDNSGALPDAICVQSTDLHTFANGGTPERAVLSGQERKTARPAEEAIAYARSQLGRTGYHILYNNCEHFVNECVFGVARSDFVEAARADIRAKREKK